MKINLKQHLCFHEWTAWTELTGIPFRYCKKCNALKRNLWLIDTIFFYNEIMHKLYPNAAREIIESIKNLCSRHEN